MDEYKEKRKGGFSVQEMMQISRNMTLMLDFIKKDYVYLQDLVNAKRNIRIFKWNKNNERIEAQKKDLETIDLQIKKISMMISRRNDLDEETVVSKTEDRQIQIQLPKGVKLDDNLPSLDVSESFKRLEESKTEFNVHMNTFKNQLIELSEKGGQIQDQLSSSIQKIEKIEDPLNQQVIKIGKMNEEIDKAQLEANRNWYRMIIILVFVVILLGLIGVLIFFMIRSGIF